MIETYSGPILVTCAYFLVYYALLGVVAKTRSRLGAAYKARGEKFDRYFGNDREMLAADRMQLNMLEQMGPFLVPLWLHAVFVSPLGATVGGAIYVASRALYPFMLGKRLGRGIKARVLIATMPGYLVICYFLGSLLWAAATA